MKLRAGALFLLVPLLLLAVHAPSASAGTLLPLVISESVEYVEGDPVIRYTVVNPGGNFSDATADPFQFNAIAFAVETYFEQFQLNGQTLTSTTTIEPTTYGYADTTRDSWQATLLTRELWDGEDTTSHDPEDPSWVGDGFGFGNVYDDEGVYLPLEDRFTTDEFGSWDQNFGHIMAAQVAFYFDNDGVQNAIAPAPFEGPDSNFTWSHPFAVSQTVTFSIAEEIVNGGAFGVGGTVIPLPSAAWMGLGLLGILAAVRRRRRAR